MTRIGYHASHEQFAPSDLLGYARNAEAAGFADVMSSDHLAPWSESQGQSGFAWSWLGAALQATRAAQFGSLAIPINRRYHPVLVAQAGATLAEMFPGRFGWIAAGSGQRLNEGAVGGSWPDKRERNDRLRAGVEIIRALWDGETVTRADGPIPVSEAKIWSLPARLPAIHAAALTPQSARWAGGWADGLITVNQPTETLKWVIEAFREGGGDGKPLLLQVHLSWAETEAQARAQAYDQWRTNVVSSRMAEELPTTAAFEVQTRAVSEKDLDGPVLISSSTQRHVDWISVFVELGFSSIYLHDVGRNQAAFIDTFGERVLPHFAAQHVA